MSKHTKGKWKLDEKLIIGDIRSDGSCVIIADINPDYVNEWDVAAYERNEEESEANSRLITSAPELLSTLKEVWQYLNQPYKSKYGNTEIISLCTEAIAKAEGEKQESA
jgi:hypothetical protein